MTNPDPRTTRDFRRMAEEGTTNKREDRSREGDAP